MLILLDFKCLPPEGVQWVSIHMSPLKTYFMNKLTQEPTGIPTHCPSRGRLWGFVGGSSSAAVFVVGKDGLMGAWWVNLCFTHLSAGNSVLSKSVALSYCLPRKLWIERSTWKSRHSRVTTQCVRFCIPKTAFIAGFGSALLLTVYGSETSVPIRMRIRMKNRILLCDSYSVEPFTEKKKMH